MALTDADPADISKTTLSHQILISEEQSKAKFLVDSPGFDFCFCFFNLNKLEGGIRKKGVL